MLQQSAPLLCREELGLHLRGPHLRTGAFIGAEASAITRGSVPCTMSSLRNPSPKVRPSKGKENGCRASLCKPDRADHALAPTGGERFWGVTDG